MHVVIYLVSGIFFWKWILLNFLFVAGLRWFGGDVLALRWQLGLLAVVLTGHALFFTAKLGWYDTLGVASPPIFAVADNCTKVRVPSNWFRATSVTVAQGRIGRPFKGHLPVGTFGTTSDSAIRNAVTQRMMRVMGSPAALSLPQWFREHVREHHAFMLRMADSNGDVAYDAYPHHIWAAPGYYKAFAEMDKRRIRAYEVIVESRLLSLTADGFDQSSVSRSRTTIPVDAVDGSRPDAGAGEQRPPKVGRGAPSCATASQSEGARV